MKKYTDIEQSEKLAEIFPTESADMCYIKHCTSDNPEWRFGEDTPPMVLGDTPLSKISASTLPCWSLVALLKILPSSTLDTSEDHHFRFHCQERFSDWHENPIDACYEIILKLF